MKILWVKEISNMELKDKEISTRGTVRLSGWPHPETKSM